MSQINGLNDTATPWLAPNTGPLGSFPAGSPGNVPWGASSSDAVRPAWFGGAGGEATSGVDALLGGGSTLMAGGNSMSAILGQLANVVQQYIGRLGNALLGTSSNGNATGTPGSRGATTFQNVTLGSTGDPHLSVTGTAEHQDGTTANVSSHFDSMIAHGDLFSTRDFGDGFNVATTVTQPNANGVTLNATATASMDGGLDSVTMTAGGGVAVTSGGSPVALAAGQSVRLAGGAMVSEAANGSVSIAETNFGQNLTTTFAPNGGGGVDVTATGTNVTLAGDLLTGGSTPVASPRLRAYSTAGQS